MFCLTGMVLNSPVLTMTTSDGKGEIGISGGLLQQRPTKVKATVATIPVGTESQSRALPSPSKLTFYKTGIK